MTLEFMTMIKIGKKILESSEVKFMNLAPYFFDVDHIEKNKIWAIYHRSREKKSPNLPLKNWSEVAVKFNRTNLLKVNPFPDDGDQAYFQKLSDAIISLFVLITTGKF